MAYSLQREVEDTAFMLVDGADRKAIHARLVKCIALLDAIKIDENQIDNERFDEGACGLNARDRADSGHQCPMLSSRLNKVYFYFLKRLIEVFSRKPLSEIRMLDKLRSEIEDAAFMLAGDADRKAIHGKLIRCLVLIDSIKVSEDQPAAVVDGENTTARNALDERSAVAVQQPLVMRHHERDVVDERNKVVRRLKMWARRQDQYNSQILNAYLELERAGLDRITEEDLCSYMGDPPWFASNFVQMKVVADRNHGKVFDADGYYVTIWEPVRSAVEEYERIVFSSEDSMESDELRVALPVREFEYSGNYNMGIRGMAKAWLQDNHPEFSANKLRTSKYFHDRDIWFFTFPRDYLDKNREGSVNMLLQQKDDVTQFYLLVVPYSFFHDNKSNLNIRSSGDQFDLHISAKKHNWLQCERSKGVSFARFQH